MSFSRNLPSESLEEIMQNILLETAPDNSQETVINDVALLPEAGGDAAAITITLPSEDL